MVARRSQQSAAGILRRPCADGAGGAAVPRLPDCLGAQHPAAAPVCSFPRTAAAPARWGPLCALGWVSWNL